MRSRLAATLNLLTVALLLPAILGAIAWSVAGLSVLAAASIGWAAAGLRRRHLEARAAWLDLFALPAVTLLPLAFSTDTLSLFSRAAALAALLTAVLLHVLAVAGGPSSFGPSPSRLPFLAASPRHVRPGTVLLAAWLLGLLVVVWVAASTASSPLTATLGVLLASSTGLWTLATVLPRTLRRAPPSHRPTAWPRVASWVLAALLGLLTWWVVGRSPDGPPPEAGQNMPGEGSPGASTAIPSSIRRIPSSSSDSVLAWIRRSEGTTLGSRSNSPSSSRTSA